MALTFVLSSLLLDCHCAARPFRRIPLLISSTGPTVSRSRQATLFVIGWQLSKCCMMLSSLHSNYRGRFVQGVNTTTVKDLARLPSVVTTPKCRKRLHCSGERSPVSLLPTMTDFFCCWKKTLGLCKGLPLQRNSFPGHSNCVERPSCAAGTLFYSMPTPCSQMHESTQWYHLNVV